MFSGFFFCLSNLISKMDVQRHFTVTNENHFHFIELGYFSPCTFLVSVAVQLRLLNEEYKILCSPTMLKR